MKLCMGCMEHYDDALKICPHCGYAEDTKPENVMHMPHGSIIADRYIIGRVIGYGGFGVTYIGWDALLETKVAVKEYLPSDFSTRMLGQTQVTIFSGDKREQFLDGMKEFVEEARKLAKFHSASGIVKIFDSFEYNNTAYIIMELLEGETLAEHLKRVGSMSAEQAITLMLPVISSLDKIHEAGITHRDIAPDNIFLTKEGGVKLIDFGAARYATTTHSRSLTVIIKPGYSPEEQYRSRGDQGPHTDVYAAAATMYRMITGQTPPDALERRANFENRKKDILKPIREFTKDIAPNHETAILNALNVRIEDRTPDMQTFLEEISAVEPIRRRTGRIRKIDLLRWPLWMKISIPSAAVLLVTFALLLLTGVIGSRQDLKTDIEIPDGNTRVPSIISDLYEDGEQKMEDAMLLLEVSGSVSSDRIPHNHILTQSINGGAIVLNNTLIRVTVSAGQVMQIVPNVVGTTMEQAVERLENLGFSVTMEEVYDRIVAEGCVVSQSLPADSEVEDGSEIVIVISKGADPSEKVEEQEVTLPDFVGMTYDELLAAARELGLNIRVTEHLSSKEFEKDTVMEQNPPSGTAVLNTETVEIVLSLGFGQVEVPSVVFMTEEQARSQLSGRNLNVTVTYQESDTAEAGLVIAQTPDSETMVDVESTVELIVSTGSAAFSMPNIVGMKEADALNALGAKGLSVSVVYAQSDHTAEGTVLSQSIPANSKVKRGDTVTITVSTGAALIAVPDVKGMMQSQAEAALVACGLRANVVTVHHDSAEKGRVISQTPAAASNLKANEMVTITVSLGAAETTAVQTEPKPIEAERIMISQDSVLLLVGNSTTLNAVITPSNAADQSVTWTSSNSNVVRVDQGVIYGVSEGEARITATTANGKTAVSWITVKEIRISVDKTAVSMKIGESTQLTANVQPANAADPSVTWSSSNSSVVRVENGTLRAVGVGTAVVTATAVNGATASCAVTVEGIQAESIMLDKTAAGMKVGESMQLTASISPNNVTDAAVTWTSSNPSVVRVERGMIYAEGAGTAIITVSTANGKTASCAVTVEEVQAESVTLDASSLTIQVGQTIVLHAAVQPGNAANTALTWTSSNPSAADVTADGAVTAKGAGMAIITVQTSNGRTASCVVSVIN